MLRTGAAIGSCLGLAAVSFALASPEAALGPIVAGAAAAGDGRATMAQRAGEARDLATREALEEAIEGALKQAHPDRADALRESAGLKSFRMAFMGEPHNSGGWFDPFLRAIGSQFKKNDDFK